MDLWHKSGCLTNVGNINDVVTLQCFPVVFRLFIDSILVLAGTTAVIMIIIASIKLIFSAGDAKQVQSAKHTLTYAIVGLVIVLLASFIVSVIAYVTGAGECLTLAGVVVGPNSKCQ